MKAILFGLLALMFTSSAFAAFPDDCWVTGAEDLTPGNFSVDINTASYSKDDLLSTLGQFTGSLQVYLTGEPLILAKDNFINFVVAPNAVTTTHTPDGRTIVESLAHQAARVNPEIQKLAALPGVTIRCAIHAVPLGGVSASNAQHE